MGVSFDECVCHSRRSAVEDGDGRIVGETAGGEEQYSFIKRCNGFPDRCAERSAPVQWAEGSGDAVHEDRDDRYTVDTAEQDLATTVPSAVAGAC